MGSNYESEFGNTDAGSRNVYEREYRIFFSGKLNTVERNISQLEDK